MKRGSTSVMTELVLHFQTSKSACNGGAKRTAVIPGGPLDSSRPMQK
jgi:hypothetical protein